MDYGILFWVFKVGLMFVVSYVLMHHFLKLIQLAVKVAVMEAVLDIYRIIIEKEQAKIKKMKRKIKRMKK